MTDSARHHRTVSAIAGLALLRPCTCPRARAGIRSPRLVAALFSLLLLHACSITPVPKTGGPGQPRAVAALFCSKPDCKAAFRPGRQIPLSTESPLSLWLYVAAASAPQVGLANVQIDLSVVDLQGRSTTGAVVQPRRLASNGTGRSPPITFLATTPGDYRIRASFDAGVSSSDSPRIAVKSGAAR